MTTASRASQSIAVQQDRTSFYKQISCRRWTIGGVGTTLAVCTLLFVILGCVQPHWFTSSVGTIGNPHAWPLWTIAGGGLIVSALLIAYAACSKEKSNQPSSIKPFYQAFSKVLGEQLFNQIPEYQECVSLRGGIDQQLMTQPVMKGYVVAHNEQGETPCIIFNLRCRTCGEDLKKKLQDLFPKDPETRRQYTLRTPQQSVILLLMRHENKWVQWSQGTENNFCCLFLPSFLNEVDIKGKITPISATGDPIDVLEAKGFKILKQLMEEGDKADITDHNGVEWCLDDRPLEERKRYR